MDASILKLSCSKGFISNIIDFGIQSKYENPELCVRNSTGVCANALNNAFNTSLHACVGNKTCEIKAPKTYVTSNPSLCAHEDAILSI